ncbi:hypothetical protein BSK71_07735 [Pectobacterium actinidiae]|uniref:Uncharacterized protein n=1 Tax=Pectobacterium actinidiae TaxID=1507808 RepID=A0A1V2R560_9GAMM|nr:hypothetical protein [Pectobacterium actinidiae]KHN91526.1 hypothetical protein KKH3_15530 [Pectobacterium actinidiae]ONK04942.1 hypothetical protein BSK69_07455 [Pectobacterium actinidiae]ONK07564.1 hypothetical protein BSK71_07735 [Pectobacterium actinidiae]
MTEEKYYDYLVIGGECHGQSFTHTLTQVLEVPQKTDRLGKMYAQHVPAEVTPNDTISHQVTEFITADGRHYFIASNEDLDRFDVENEIIKSGISPI